MRQNLQLAACALCTALLLGLTACTTTNPVPPGSESEPGAPTTATSGPESATSEPEAEEATDGPSHVVKQFLTALKALDTSTMQQFLTDPDSEGAILQVDGSMDFHDRLGMDFARAYLSAVDFSVDGETVRGNSAKVELSLSVPDLTDVITKLVVEITKYATSQALKGAPVDAEAFLLDYIADNVKVEELPVASKTVSVSMRREDDGSWRIDNSAKVNFGLVDALTGGILEKLEGLSGIMK
ncbi:DUF5105 domain-containing protein [Ruminococcaceae bacterium OttesenSCG-928-L11]|nr:DUF5105 domain-containing protein [Ruminococcaceae bacterium OttesenSCG-928-L11]